MADENGTIESPEDVLLAAVMAPDAQDLEARDPNKLDPPQNLDEDDEPVVEGEDKQPEPKAREAEPEAKEPEEDYIELPGEDGAEPTRLKVADVVADYQAFQQFKGQQQQAIERVEQEALTKATAQYRNIEQVSQQAGLMIQATLQLLQRPAPPNADAMLNPNSPQYDPDGYHRAFAAWQRGDQTFLQAQKLGEDLLKQAEAAKTQAQEARESRELERLNRAWPEFAAPETFNKFIADMGKAYGFSPQELDDVLVDHRQALVARDALAYRAMKAQSGDVKAKVEAKAPKVVRTKTEAKAASAQARDPKGRFADGALATLKKTNSDDAAAAYFTGLVKAGRI